MDLFAAPTKYELKKRNEDRVNNCPHLSSTVIGGRDYFNIFKEKVMARKFICDDCRMEYEIIRNEGESLEVKEYIIPYKPPKPLYKW